LGRGKDLNIGSQMEIKGKVHCFFEQSGTFKNEFIKLGIHAEDYDIQNNFGETDHVVDLFENIQNAYEGGASVFDNITKDDLILAFFPCIKFCSVMEQIQHSDFYDSSQKKNKNFGTPEYYTKKWNTLRRYSQERFYFYDIALKLIAVAEIRGLRLIIENPWHPTNFTNHFFPLRVTLIDNDRTIRGDYYKKPTGYWFLNCEPTHGETVQPCPLELRRKLTAGSGGGKKKKELISAGCSEYDVAMYIEHETKTGLCDTKRSEIRTDYARNFICDFILGKRQEVGQLTFGF